MRGVIDLTLATICVIVVAIALTTATFVVGITIAGTVHAEPPDGADPNSELAQWYHKQLVPDGPLKGGLCCDVADCRPVITREHDGSVEAYIDKKTFPKFSDGAWAAPDAWVRVPDEAVIRGEVNLPGEPVACWYGGIIRCFIPGPGI